MNNFFCDKYCHKKLEIKFVESIIQDFVNTPFLAHNFGVWIFRTILSQHSFNFNGLLTILMACIFFQLLIFTSIHLVFTRFPIKYCLEVFLMDLGILFFSKNRCDNFFHRLKLDDHLLMMTSALGIFPADWQSWGHSVKKIHRDFLLCRVYKLFNVIPQKMGVLDIFLFCPFGIGFGLLHRV